MKLIFVFSLYSNFLRTFWMVKFLLQSLNILIIIENTNVEARSRTLGISHLKNGTLFLSWAEEGLFLAHTTSEYVQNRIKQKSFYAHSFCRS